MFFMILIGIEQPHLIENFDKKVSNVHYEHYYVFNQFIHWVQAFFYDFPNNFNASIKYLPFIAFIIPFFSLFRLAHFNLDTRQQEISLVYLLPKCDNDLFFSLYFHENMMAWNHEINAMHFLFDCYSLAVIAVLFSLLLISPLPLMSMKLEGINKFEKH